MHIYYLLLSLFLTQELSSIFRNKKYAVLFFCFFKVFLKLLCIHYVLGILKSYYKENISSKILGLFAF